MLVCTDRASRGMDFPRVGRDVAERQREAAERAPVAWCTRSSTRSSSKPSRPCRRRHVVLFDFPRDGVEYVRRVGRVTRGDRSPGRVTSLVLGRQLAYARALMKINREGGAVDLETHGAFAVEPGA